VEIKGRHYGSYHSRDWDVRIKFPCQPRQLVVRTYLKGKLKRAGDIAQVVVCLQASVRP
jgi:hypothetical protein